jgi:hypothetical protein
MAGAFVGKILRACLLIQRMIKQGHLLVGAIEIKLVINLLRGAVADRCLTHDIAGSRGDRNVSQHRVWQMAQTVLNDMKAA